MLEGIPLALGDIGPWGLLTLVVALIFLGMYRRKLVPEKELLDEQEEKRYWRAAAERSEEARREADQQVGELASAVGRSNELGEMSLAILRALRDQSGVTGGDAP